MLNIRIEKDKKIFANLFEHSSDEIFAQLHKEQLSINSERRRSMAQGMGIKEEGDENKVDRKGLIHR